MIELEGGAGRYKKRTLEKVINQESNEFLAGRNKGNVPIFKKFKKEWTTFKNFCMSMVAIFKYHKKRNDDVKYTRFEHWHSTQASRTREKYRTEFN